MIDNYFTIEEVAAKLGYSSVTIYRWIKLKSIPTYRILSRTVISKEQLDYLSSLVQPKDLEKTKSWKESDDN